MTTGWIVFVTMKWEVHENLSVRLVLATGGMDSHRVKNPKDAAMETIRINCSWSVDVVGEPDENKKDSCLEGKKKAMDVSRSGGKKSQEIYQ